MKQKKYFIFDMLVECDLELPELPQSDKGSPALYISKGRTLDKQSIDWHHDWQENNITHLRFGFLGDRHVLEFPGLSYFLISIENRTIEYHPVSNIPSESIRHLLLDQVIPRTLGQYGQLILHASAVKLADGTGIAFLGESGWGKSTLASSFSGSGAQLLSDDCLLIENKSDRLTATASYHGVRLLRDSAAAIFPDQTESEPVAHYSDKQRISLGPENSALQPPSCPLDALFLLNDPAENKHDESIEIKTVRGMEEMMSLIKQTFVLDPLDKKLITILFTTLGDFLQTGIPIYRIRYPRDHNLLPDIQQAIMAKV